MATNKYLKILKQGVKIWNGWRKKNREVRPNLFGANLSNMDLRSADFLDVSLELADLSNSNLTDVEFGFAYLAGANFNYAVLENARLRNANLSSAGLIHADLSYSDLSGANLERANLTGATLTGAELYRTNFSNAILDSCDLTGASLYYTTFGNNDLRSVKGLDGVNHSGPSTIGMDTIYRSKGRLLEFFLRGAGLPDNFIIYADSLTKEAFQLYSCFISYSSSDSAFAERLHTDLQIKGVRCWFAPENLKIGDRLRYRIDESIKLYDKLLLVLSQNSVKSQWVEQEVETALTKEREERRTVLFPIRLDDAILQSSDGWPALIRNTRHIGDFTGWDSYGTYSKAFNRLMRDLDAVEPREDRG